MTIAPPKEVNVTYEINMYKDMEIADETILSGTCTSYGQAIELYNNLVTLAKGGNYIEMRYHVEFVYEDRTDVSDFVIAHNYSDDITTDIK